MLSGILVIISILGTKISFKRCPLGNVTKVPVVFSSFLMEIRLFTSISCPTTGIKCNTYLRNQYKIFFIKISLYTSTISKHIIMIKDRPACSRFLISLFDTGLGQTLLSPIYFTFLTLKTNREKYCTRSPAAHQLHSMSTLQSSMP